MISFGRSRMSWGRGWINRDGRTRTRWSWNNVLRRRLASTLPDGTFVGVSPATRRRMQRIRSRGNLTTEMRLRFRMVADGLRGWQLHTAVVPGRPDFYFPACRLAVFVDGCFWHGCPVCGHLPTRNSSYWREKIESNLRRDREVGRVLTRRGIGVIRLWEHDVQNDIARCLSRITSAVRRRN